MNQQAFDYARQFTESTFKAQSALLKGLEQAATLQFKALEQQTEALASYAADAMEVRDAESLRTLWDKTGSLQRDQVERQIAIAQDLVGLAQSTAESLGALVRTPQAPVSKPAAKKAA
jgi:hypothetical protein